MPRTCPVPLWSLLAFTVLGAVSALAAPLRPNIVVILADDMGYSDIGCYGGEISTPNIDRLAEGGLRFTQAYNTGRCCPTRASLLTGLYPHQAGVGHMMRDNGLPGYTGDLNDRCVTIAEVLKGAGYGTYMSGKWHVTRHVEGDGPKDNWPRQRGFDRFYGIIHGAASFYDPVTLTRDNERIKTPTGDYYFTDAISDNAVQYVNEHIASRKDDPFFMYVSYTSPHWPLHAREKDIARYAGKYDGGWDTLRDTRRARMLDMGILEPDWALTPRDGKAPSWAAAENKSWHARRMEVYAAQIDSMDQGIGRIVTALEKTGALENTLILFLADNGGCAEEIGRKWGGRHIPERTRNGEPVLKGNRPELMPGPENTYQSYGLPWANASNTPFREYKHWVHEGGISTPLVVHWPAAVTSAAELRREPVHLIDIMTTCLDVADAAYPAAKGGVAIHPMEGLSLVPAFEGKALEREAIYWEHEGNRAVRMGDWKLVAKGSKGPWELYNLGADRSETRDLAGVETARMAAMTAQWNAWAERAHVIPWPWNASKK
jgi:arylsulfatase A-like enzyme